MLAACSCGLCIPVFVWIVWEAAELGHMQKVRSEPELLPSLCFSLLPCLLCHMQSFKIKRARSDACLFPVSLQCKHLFLLLMCGAYCLLPTAWKCLISNSQVAAQKTANAVSSVCIRFVAALWNEDIAKQVAVNTLASALAFTMYAFMCWDIIIIAPVNQNTELKMYETFAAGMKA